MPSYTPIDLERIAAAIGVSSTAVQEQASRFEIAALWYRLDRGLPNPAQPSRKPRTPYAQRIKMEQIARSARRLRMNLTSGSVKAERAGASFRRLLKDLEIAESAIEDGPRDPEILQLLTYPEGSSVAHALSLIRQLGCRPELEARIAAAAELERLASHAAAVATRLGDLVVPKGHHGDRAVNDWIVEMMRIYGAITGSEPRTSVGPVNYPDEGIAGGPFIRFLAAAARPLGIAGSGGVDYSEDAWRSRIRNIQAAAPGQN